MSIDSAHDSRDFSVLTPPHGLDSLFGLFVLLLRDTAGASHQHILRNNRDNCEMRIFVRNERSLDVLSVVIVLIAVHFSHDVTD